MRVWIAAVLAMLMLTSCSEVEETPPLVLSTDVWIGTAPLYYAYAMGWLKAANIQMLQAESIDDNLEHYNSKAADIITGTAHEYRRLLLIHPDLIPIIIYDRSYGGDVVLSNRTLAQIRHSSENIDVYVEENTVSEEMLNYFWSENNLSKQRFTLCDRKQDEIETLMASPLTPPTIAVTYNPHDTILKKQGFFELTSSKNDRYLIVDGIYVSSELAHKHSKQMVALRNAFGAAVRAYHHNPKAFYDTVKPYLGNVSYEEFGKMVHNIQWMEDHNLTLKMLQQLQQNHFPTQDLIP
jgi:NitT/TauT family transport system substrate-binding protein